MFRSRILSKLRQFTTKATHPKSTTTKTTKTIEKVADKTTSSSLKLKPTPSPSPTTTIPEALPERANALRLFAEGAISISLVYGIFWGVETQSFVPTNIDYLHLQSMFAGGAGIAFAFRAKGCNISRRLAVGALAGSYALYGSASQTRWSDTNKRVTATTISNAGKDISLAIVTMLPFLSASLSRSTIRFSSRNMIGVVLSSSCLLGATLCDYKPKELDIVWKRLDATSRNSGLFLEWLHWFGYIMLGGGAVAMIAGPIAMYGHLCYTTLPEREEREERKEQMATLENMHDKNVSYRHRQRTVSAFFPISYSNRYVSDHHLYESLVQDQSVTSKQMHSELEPVVLGEWIVDVEIRPLYDQLLGRDPFTLNAILPKWIINVINGTSKNDAIQSLSSTSTK